MSTTNPLFPPDSIRRQFDAAKFRLDETGRPRLDSQGRFVNLKNFIPLVGIAFAVDLSPVPCGPFAFW